MIWIIDFHHFQIKAKAGRVVPLRLLLYCLIIK
jgi:hypothetical protein